MGLTYWWMGQHDKINILIPITQNLEIRNLLLLFFFFFEKVRILYCNFQLFWIILFPSWLKYLGNKVQLFCLPWFFFFLINHVTWNFFGSCFGHPRFKSWFRPCQMNSDCGYMHCYYNKIVYMHIFTAADVGIFRPNCVYMTTFSILDSLMWVHLNLRCNLPFYTLCQ